MQLPGTLCFFVMLFSLTQVKEAIAGCDITSISSPTASSMLVKWSSFTGATSFYLDVKAVNSTSLAPISLQLAASVLEKLVQGLKPGQIYQVTLKVFQFNYMTCINSQTAQTIPATSQITYSKAISSTSIRFEWSSAQGADKYILIVNGTFHSEFHNLTFTTLNGQVDNLLRSASYNCYVYSSNAAGLGAKSLVRTIRTLVQPPDVVNVTTLTQSSAQVTWTSVLNVLLYQVSVSANNKPGTGPVLKNVTGTAVNISNLEPCTTYTIGVASINMFLEPGESTNISYTTSTIAPVSSFSVQYSCMTATAWVSWDAVFGAMSYLAVIRDDQGRSLNCTSTDTTCAITSLQCGKQYTARITAIANCESISDGSYSFETAPCPPKSPALYRECSTNVILFSWNPTNNTAYYIAMAVDSDGQVTECLTVDTSCYFTDTYCGKSYTFYVSSIYSGGLECQSENTAAVVIRTAPCLPQNIHTTADCNTISRTAVTSWDAALGAQTYTVEGRGNRKDFYNCTSMNTSCTLTDVDCGESLSIWMIATDGDCTTDPVMGEVAETAPCAPQNVSAVGNCSSNSASLTWLSGNGAIYYIGVVTHTDGTVYTCTSMGTECIVQNLRCGATYDAYVIGTNIQCNSSASQHVSLQTAPCAPVNVGVTRDCSGNLATVSWQTLQAGGLYTAALQDDHGASVNCSTSLNNCTFANLTCGVNYNVTITMNDGRCRSLPSTPFQIQSAPCDPQNFTTAIQCDTNTANVTWAASAGARGYTVMATDAQQQRIASCHSVGTSCQLTSLPCGTRLNVTIQADGTTCNSSSRSTAVVVTAPCSPTQVTAALNCTSNVASVTWYSSLGATWYLVKLEGSLGYKTSCNNTATRCDIPNLQCGQEYSITVMGMNRDCRGSASQTVTLVSAPCPNTNIQATLDCHTNSALISWTPGNGSLSFNATLQSFLDVQQHSCFTSGSSCNISSLQCGQHYNISLTGYGQNCSTPSKPLVAVDTAPCAPTQVNVSFTCGSDTASVSWAASSGLVSQYIVTAGGDNGRTLTCNSSSTSCAISGLSCGQAYNVSVTPMSANCTGQRSDVRRIYTAPCAPQNVSANVSCSSNIATVTWGISQGAELYTVTASSANGLSANCTSASTSCDLVNLSCGETYTITVKAKVGSCGSGNSTAVQIQTAPCPNTNIQATLDCRTNSALISWTPGNGSLSFNATLQSFLDAQQHSCFTSGSSCNISSLQCGQHYNISLTGYGQNCSTPSKPLVAVDTAPCAPTQVNVSFTCGSDTASVSWAASSGLVSQYIVTAGGDNGRTLTCNSSSTSCAISGLSCGQAYNVSVTTMSANCTGQRSDVRRIYTTPCAPQNVSANVSCSSNIATVTWGISQGAELYTVTASSANGLSANCTSASTSCDLVNLSCGETYTITVKAKVGSCSSGNSTAVQIQTAPCPNTNIQATLDCRTNSALISWTPGNGSLSFNATLQSFLDAQQHSCFTSGSSCNISSLQCGQHYNISLTGYGQNCSTTSKPLVAVDTAPCAPTQVNVSFTCGSDTASVSWAASSGLVSQYIVTAGGDNGRTLTCNSSSTSCAISGLSCGQVYNVSVTPMSANCTGQRSDVRRFFTAPCAPQNVSANVSCSSNIATVTWGISQGAELYTVTASSANGLSANCTSASTSCDLVNLSCGETYTITVKAKVGSCSGNSTAVQIKTAPCPNTNIQATLDCRTNSALISWTPGNGSLSFNATLQSFLDAQQHSCFTSGSSCNISSLQCGQHYNISLTGYGQNCSTPSKPLVAVDTAPCAPTQVNVSFTCGSDTASVSWAASSGLVSQYIVTAGGDNGRTLTCNSSSTSCTISGLSCGQAYNVSVTPMSANCTGQHSDVRRIYTAPCAPQNVSANVSCSSNIATVTWGMSQGAELYTVTASSANGLSANCTSASTSCDLVNLSCGETYTITVKAKVGSCGSGNSTAVQIQTAPCPNTNIQATLDCRSNSALISWTPGNGSLSFNATLQSFLDAQQHSCFTSGSSCNISSLQCGQHYNISLTGYGQNCSTPSKPLVAVDTAPCAPTQVNVSFTCGSDTASVSWAASSGLVSQYIVTAGGDNGRTLTCNSSSTSCTISGLSCGQAYNVSVTPMSANCTGQRSDVHRFFTAPCAPQNVSANVSCSSNIATVTWGISQGAELYTVTASSANGLSANCTSASTSCDLVNLSCGETYTITVKAKVGSCSGNSTAVQIKTAPCPNTNIQATLDCRTNSALISWTPGNGSLSFNATLQSFLDAQQRSCFTSGSSCNISSLQCGQHYNISLTGYSQNCSTPSKPLVTVDTAPCAPSQVNVSFTCGSDTASVSWAASSGLVSQYIVTAGGDNGRTLTCNSSSTSCTISGLSCGQAYNVSVTPMSANCTGQRSDVHRFFTAPCAPQNVSANVNCSNNIATVTWGISQGAELYTVTASSANGLSANCTSASTSCDLVNLSCGETQAPFTLTITVKAKVGSCGSGNSTAVQIQTAPCPNTNIQATLDCHSNSALISWTPGNGSLSFNATLQSFLDAQQHSCFTSGSSCNISSLQCGQHYNISLTGYGQNCSTPSKPLVTVDTAPCAPTQVNVSFTCGSDTASVSWAASSGLVSQYIVTAGGDNGRTLTCNSSSTSCAISGLSCGQAYNVSVTPISANCTGQRSDVRRFFTAPCAPQNVSANVSCSSNIATVTWGISQGAELYTVTASSANGLSANCTSASTSCDLVNLSCGETYTITVKAKVGSCGSGNSTTVQIQTAPCPNTNIQATLDCRTNSALISWTPGNGSLSFNATLQSFLDAQQHSCFTSGSSCNISSLQCGQHYNISLTGYGQNCSTPSKPLVAVDTAPCAPTQVNVSFTCGSDTASVSWAASSGLVSQYIVTARGDNGRTLTCNSSSTSCTISGLSCGQAYNVSVTPMSANCTGQRSDVRRFFTAPCAPQNVSANVNCSNNIATVTWGISQGAELYTVTASSANGLSANCTSASTSCDLVNLSCGETYTITVKAKVGSCGSGNSTAVQIKTAPCPNTNIQATLDCRTNSALISWTPGNGSLSFNATLQSFLDAQQHSCFTSGSSCNISSLQCGQHYNISLTGYGQNCSTPSKPLVTVDTAPCAPTQVNVSFTCGSDTASVSWAASSGLVSQYIVTAGGDNGRTLTCNSSSTSCTISGLSCGQAYNVSVTPMSANCTGQRSDVRRFFTAPCAPQNVSANVSCSSNIATVTWGMSQGAELYTVTASSANGLSANCTSASTSCDLVNLSCGETYTITVKAKVGSCGSENSTAVQIQTAPCPNTNIQATLDCHSNSALISWTPGNGSLSFNATLQSFLDAQQHSCFTSGSSCNISSLQCGQHYNISLTGYGQNCSTPSKPLVTVDTAPCAPTQVNVSFTCGSDTASVSWAASSGLVSQYIVTAGGDNGRTLTCNSSSTSCAISGLSCGQAYNVSVTPMSANCTGQRSDVRRFFTAPCAPQIVSANVSCSSNIATVTWGISQGAELYAVTASSANGLSANCTSASTSCDLVNLSCGETYTITVKAKVGSCGSGNSTAVQIQTAPCPNNNIQATLDCRTNSALISWTPGNGSLSFNATLQSFLDAQQHSCFTSGSSCNISSLQCGQHYNISLTGYGQNCSTPSKPLVAVDTAPCAPTQVNVSFTCGSDNASVSWAASSGLVSQYIVTAEGDNGRIVTCNSSSTSCTINGLSCGQAYNISVTPMRINCTGQRSEVRRVYTAPCPPQNVSAKVQCESGSVLVNWSLIADATQFIAKLVSQSTGVIFTCNNTIAQCSINNLPCGETFSANVQAVRDSCQSQPSSALNISTAPCTPQGVNGTVNCVTNSAWISWDADKGAQSYSVLALSNDGQNVTCFSSNTTCNVPDLGCGRSYTFQVTASNAACQSPPSNSFALDTAPCTLSSIVVTADCQSSVIVVQWQRTRQGSSLYIATAEDQYHALLSCNSSASSCNLTSVQCDREYTIIVAASSNQCSSLRSPPYKIRTAPCPPSRVQAYTDCQSKAVFVSWDPSYVAQSYLLSAFGRDGEVKSCNTSTNNCTLTYLRCSSTYSLSVVAINENCTSLPSTNVTFKTAPCEPTNLTASMQCGNNSASLSWVGSTGAVAYMGLAQSQNGTTVYCQTTTTSCTLAGLVCGTMYNFTVQATNGTCNSSWSKPLTLGAGPCPPAGLKVIPLSIVNDTQILRASWSTVNCPNSEYLLALKGSLNGKSWLLFDLASYWSSRTSFEMPLPCSSSYNATVRAGNYGTLSDESAAVTGTTVPCAPLNVTFSASPQSVSWSASIFATNYTAYLITSSARMKLCMTSQLLCSVTVPSSGQIVVTAKNVAGESSDSVPVSVTAVRRRR